MYVDHIEFQTRAALVAALLELRKTPGVVKVDVVGLGRTLQVTHTNGEGAHVPEVEVPEVEPIPESEIEQPTPEPVEDLIGESVPPKKRSK